jgi:hypothetical protein
MLVVKRQKNQTLEAAYFGPPPLFQGEDASSYQQFLDEVVDFAKPADIVEKIWVRDYVDLHWDVDRLRRIKATLISSAKSDVKSMALRFVTSLESEEEDDRGDDESLEKAAVLLERERRSDDASLILPQRHAARGFANEISGLARIERMLATMEARRDKALHQLEKRRAALAARVKQAIKQQVEDELQVTEEMPDELKNLGKATCSKSAQRACQHRTKIRCWQGALRPQLAPPRISYSNS